MTQRIMREKEVCKRIGVSRSTIWRWERQGVFPKRRKIGTHAVGWPEREIDEWQKALPTARIGGNHV